MPEPQPLTTTPVPPVTELSDQDKMGYLPKQEIITSCNPLIKLPIIKGGPPAHWAMSCRFTPAMQRQKGKEKQVFRDDVTYVQFKKSGDNIDHLHPIAILLRLLERDRWMFTQADFYDNHIMQVDGTRNQQILKVTIKGGVLDFFSDHRLDYYDVNTGLPHAHCNRNKMPNQNL